ncbi:MAG TPA: lipid-A-disaccharide synthase, partial [SAR324 cluster bacterium]|nr:lipid-A-disaccharide synthase [SAR324 cluster bacterium]
MKLMLVAGEASGDVHGSALLKELKALVPHLETFGIGGRGMLEQGLRPYFMLDTMQSHGITELALHLPRLFRTLWLMQEALEAERPDALILIDYPGFNLKLGAHAKKLGIPVIFFSSPQVWVWRSGRIRKIKNSVDLMLVLFPFESKIYENAGVQVRWVGHPLLDQDPSPAELENFREECGLNGSQT